MKTEYLEVLFKQKFEDCKQLSELEECIERGIYSKEKSDLEKFHIQKRIIRIDQLIDEYLEIHKNYN